MKKQSIVSLSLSAVVGGILFSACGDDVTKVTNVTNETSGMEIVSSADSLGACDSANVGKIAYASDKNIAYICADSGWAPFSKNSGGKDGTSCATEILSDSSGYKIVCGEDSVGVIRNGQNGENGTDGKTGEKGDAGENGTTCTVEALFDGTGYKVVCGGDSVGVVRNGLGGNGCTITDNGDGTVSQVCGEDTIRLYKTFCGGTPYDPEKAFCQGDSLYSCGEKAYDPAWKFCVEEKIYDLCRGEVYDPAKKLCKEGTLYELCGETPYDRSTEFCDFRDAKIYGYTVIGEQTWMAENLNFAYRMTDADGNETSDSISFCYDNDSANCETYGRLYTWAAAMDSAAVFSDEGKDCGYGVKCAASGKVQGVCPEGYHLPDTTEWKVLIDYVADRAPDAASGSALKSTSGWNNDGNGSDLFGFAALPAGYRNDDGQFEKIRESVEFWTSTSVSEYGAYKRFLDDVSTVLWNSGATPKNKARSVRCVKDAD